MANAGGASGSATYDAVTAFAVKMPGWIQALMVGYTSYGLVLVAPLFAWLWWRARKTGAPERMAAALLVPAGTVGAYLLSELVKAFVHEQRPCHGLPPSAIVGVCPAAGDWSFPSNHSTIAAATALGAAFAWRRGAPWLALFAASMGFSRVFVGAHYPHDVLIGLALGAGVAMLLQRYAVAPATALVQRFAGRMPYGLLGTVPPVDDAGPGSPREVVAEGAQPVRGARPAPRRDVNAGAPVRGGAPTRNGASARTSTAVPARPARGAGRSVPPAQGRNAGNPVRGSNPVRGGNPARGGNSARGTSPAPRPGRVQQPRPAGPSQGRPAGPPPR